MIIKTILRLIGNTLVYHAYVDMVIHRYMVEYILYYYIILFYVPNHKVKININYFISLSILFKRFKFSQYFFFFYIGFHPKCQLLASHF